MNRAGVRVPKAIVVALAVLAGLIGALLVSAATAGAATPGTFAFSGSSWFARSTSGIAGPGPNVFSSSPENVWVDSVGSLHLRITFRDGAWQCAEVFLDRSLGYGTYSFSVSSSLGALDPNVVLGLFTYDDDPAANHREIDVEMARWGSAAGSTNAQYVVQPYTKASNLKRFVEPSGASVHSFTWRSRSVGFSSTTADGRPVSSWSYTGTDVPRSGQERVHLNLWLDRGNPPANGAVAEVVLSRFSFTK